MKGDGRVKVYIAVCDFVTDQRPVAVYIRFSQRGDMRKKQVSLTVRALEIQGELTATMLHLEEIYLRTVTDSEYTAACPLRRAITAMWSKWRFIVWVTSAEPQWKPMVCLFTQTI